MCAWACDEEEDDDESVVGLELGNDRKEEFSYSPSSWKEKEEESE